MPMNRELRVLIVEPDDDFRLIFGILLDTLGYTVTTASCGSDALVEIAKHVPDVVFTELQLSDMTGLELLANTRAVQAGRDVVFIAITSRVKIGIEEQVLKRGFEHCFAKPITTSRIIAVLAQIAEKKGLVPPTLH